LQIRVSRGSGRSDLHAVVVFKAGGHVCDDPKLSPWGGLRARSLSASAAPALVLVRWRLRDGRRMSLGNMRREGLLKARATLVNRLALGLLASAIAIAGWRFGGRRAGNDASTVVILRIPGNRPLRAAEIVFEPASGVRSVRLGATGWLAIERNDASIPIVVRIPGMCPVTLAPLGAGAPPARDVRPLIDLGDDRVQIGFAAPFAIHAVRGCSEADLGKLSWRQIDGPPLAELRIDRDGMGVRGRTLPLAALHPEPLPFGIVPLSPRTQGRYVLEAVWRAIGDPEVRTTLTVTSIARATGVPSLAVSQEVLLGGAGWRVVQAPHGGTATVRSDGPLLLFAPDAPGPWHLEDASARRLTIQAQGYENTPFDCGRSECHAAIARTTATTAMAHALEGPIGRAQEPSAALGCLLDCHATGERGLHDGGFIDVAKSLGWRSLTPSVWEDLPQPLRRLGGVRCMSCHGPGAIPDLADRSAILRSDVCAICHDAPPAYGVVQAWRASRMSRSDLSSRTRRDATCARCHTTAGFLDAIGVRKRGDTGPDPVTAGIACAACHAPHDEHRGDRLVRIAVAPSSLGPQPEGGPRSTVCALCHSPVTGEPNPSASSAALWGGSVQLPALRPSASGPPVWVLFTGPTAHLEVAGGCVGCHGRKGGLEARDTDHSFRVDRTTCAPCHADGVTQERTGPADRSVRQRAIKLRDDVARLCTAAGTPAPNDPPHAAGTGAACSGDELVRARYEVALVLEDPAAEIHNAPFARALLADAEALLASVSARR
jgi:hypothetical protein